MIRLKEHEAAARRKAIERAIRKLASGGDYDRVELWGTPVAESWQRFLMHSLIARGLVTRIGPVTSTNARYRAAGTTGGTTADLLLALLDDMPALLRAGSGSHARPPDAVIGLRAAGKLLGVSDQTVLRMLSDGRLSARRMDDVKRTYVFSAADLTRAAALRADPDTAPAAPAAPGGGFVLDIPPDPTWEPDGSPPPEPAPPSEEPPPVAEMLGALVNVIPVMVDAIVRIERRLIRVDRQLDVLCKAWDAERVPEVEEKT